HPRRPTTAGSAGAGVARRRLDPASGPVGRGGVVITVPTALEELPAVLTAEEAAAVLRVSRWAIYEAVKRGELRSVRLGRCLRIPRQALLEVLGVDVVVGDGRAANGHKRGTEGDGVP